MTHCSMTSMTKQFMTSSYSWIFWKNANLVIRWVKILISKSHIHQKIYICSKTGAIVVRSSCTTWNTWLIVQFRRNLKSLIRTFIELIYIESFLSQATVPLSTICLGCTRSNLQLRFECIICRQWIHEMCFRQFFATINTCRSCEPTNTSFPSLPKSLPDTGLQNSENNCWLNSTIQMILRLPIFDAHEYWDLAKYQPILQELILIRNNLEMSQINDIDKNLRQVNWKRILQSYFICLNWNLSSLSIIINYESFYKMKIVNRPWENHWINRYYI